MVFLYFPPHAAFVPYSEIEIQGGPGGQKRWLRGFPGTGNVGSGKSRSREWGFRDVLVPDKGEQGVPVLGRRMQEVTVPRNGGSGGLREAPGPDKGEQRGPGAGEGDAGGVTVSENGGGGCSSTP